MPAPRLAAQAALRFGTDGVRAVANSALTTEYAMALGAATAEHFGASHVLIGADPRRSSPMLAAAICAGVASTGVDAVDVGVVPTPAVAWSSADENVPAVMVSASHNPAADNGLKVFSPGGRKLDDAAQEHISQMIRARLDGTDGERPSGPGVGLIRRAQHVVDGLPAPVGYAASIESAVGGPGVLGGRTVLLDCANGASSAVAAPLFRRLGAEVRVLFDQPDGMNINDGCGSTHPETLQQAVHDASGAVGFAFDGDADRCLAVDEHGELIDGDQLMAIAASHLHSAGRLSADTLVATVMSNLGLEQALNDRGITLVRTAVGDRYVADAMASTGAILGGEQSGHLIFGEWATTGDGLLSAAVIASILSVQETTLAEAAAAAMTRLPQVTTNVRYQPPFDVSSLDEMIADVSNTLGQSGRVLVRASGTEPVIRVMVEAADSGEAQAHADALVAEIAKRIRGSNH